jgi:hypothetical protein
VSVVLVPNPGYTGEPRVMEAVCHDGTPFLTMRCLCGAESHVHESQVSGVPGDAEIAARCSACRQPIVCPPGFFADAFAEMRSEGWIA